VTRNFPSAALIAMFLVLAPSIRAQEETASTLSALSAAQQSFAETKVIAWKSAQSDNLDINSIGKLSLMLIHVKGGEGTPEKYYFVFNPDATAPSPSPDTTAQVNPPSPPPTTVVAKYKFPGDGELLSLPANQLIELPSNVDMFQVEFSWPNGDGPKEACHLIASPDPKCPCAQKDNDDGKKPSTQSDTKCCFLEAVFLRDLTKDLKNALTKDQSNALKN
jgi:hypothetical protein